MLDQRLEKGWCPGADYTNSMNSMTYAKVGHSVFAHDHYAFWRDCPTAWELQAAGVQDKVQIEELDVTSAASTQTATASILARTGNTLDADSCGSCYICACHHAWICC